MMRKVQAFTLFILSYSETHDCIEYLKDNKAYYSCIYNSCHYSQNLDSNLSTDTVDILTKTGTSFANAMEGNNTISVIREAINTLDFL